jgi:hypothetical protein
VLASETSGVRSLSEQLAALPVSRPEGLSLSLDIERGIEGLLSLGMPQLEARSESEGVEPLAGASGSEAMTEKGCEHGDNQGPRPAPRLHAGPGGCSRS